MSKKKFIFLFVLIQSVVFFSCKKDPSGQDNSAPQSMFDLITEDSLQFQSYIIKWNSSKADTLYQRGGNHNRWNLDTAWFKFNKDGMYKGNMSLNYNYSAQWGFLENGAKLRLWNSNFDQKFTVLKLTKDTIEWLDPKTDNLFYRFVRK
jgi:hypothetical protein